MKKIFTYLSVLALPLLLFSCTKKAPEAPVSKMKGVFYTSIPASGETLELLPGKSKSLDLRACAQEVSDMYVSMSFKVDPDAVAAYNSANGASCEMLPSSAFEFTKNEVMLPKYNKASTTAKIRVTATGLEDNKPYVLPVTIDKVVGTDNWELTSSPVAFIKVIQVNTGPEGGDGSKEYPYILTTPEDMAKMNEKLSSEEMVYFRMTNDIDMSGIDNWIPLNYQSPYDKAIDFDGAGHTVTGFHCNFASYPSFFGVMNGICHDVTFRDAVIESGGDSGCGILGGYGGSGAVHCEVMRVHVNGSVTLTGNKTGVGGMFGTLGNATIMASSADCVVTSGRNFVGGLYGYAKKDCVVTDCWTSGTVTGAQRVGGIGGGTDKTGTGVQIINCYSTAKVYGGFALGGIGGFYNLDNADGTPDLSHPDNTIMNCIAWNEEIKANSTTAGDLSHYSIGMVIGYTSLNNTHIGCIRRSDAAYNTAILFDYSDAFAIYDQDDSSPNSPLMVNAVAGANYNFPYHGKAAPAGKSLSEVAKGLGWSDSVWDFSGEIPVIKADATFVPVEDVNGEGGIGDWDENKIN